MPGRLDSLPGEAGWKERDVPTTRLSTPGTAACHWAKRAIVELAEEGLY